MHYGFKFSTAIYTSFFTGKVPTNYAGKEIFSDNLFYQMRNAGMRMKFVGPKFPTLALLGDGAYQYFEELIQVNSENQVLDFLHENAFNSFLPDAARRGQSLFFTTNLLDERIHKSGKKDPKNQALLPALKPIFQKLKQFVDSNPDYLLILNSDHGGSPTGGKHEGQLHGVPDGGNEAWILFYNPNLTPLGQQGSWMDTVDVCGTISGYFSGVNIPMESVGIASPSTDSISHKYKLRKLNSLQIRQLAELKKFPYDNNLYETAFKEPDLATATTMMETFIKGIKAPLIDFKRFPTIELIYDIIFVVLFQGLLIMYEFPSFGSILKAFLLNPVCLVAPYVFIYLDLMFLKFDYFKSFPTYFNYHWIMFGLSMLYAFYQFNNYAKTQGVEFNERVYSSDASYFNSDITADIKTKQYVLKIWATRLISVVCVWFVSRMVLVVEYWTWFPLQLFSYIGLVTILLYDSGLISKHASSLNQLKNINYKSNEFMYLVLILFVYLYEFVESIALMQLVYTVVFFHSVYCLFKKPHLLVYPSTLLLFIISGDEERFFLVFVLTPAFSLLATVFRDLPSCYGEEGKDSFYIIRNLEKMILLFSVNFAFNMYVYMGGEFNMNVKVDAGAVGVVNVEQYPMLSAFLMAYHKLGYFFILAAFLGRFIVYDKEKFDGYSSLSGCQYSYFQFNSSMSYVWKVMMLKSLVLMWTFHLSFWLYKDYITCFIMMCITTLVTLLYGALLLFYHGQEFFTSLANLVTELYYKRKKEMQLAN
jgi:hypothetical protein